MWAEDDCEQSAEPCLESCTEPTDNKIYTMYHGTSQEAARQIKATGFRQSSDGMLGRGVYVSRDLQKASRYPLHLPEKDRVVLKLRVHVGKVKKIDCQGHPMQKTWHNHGYDTAWVPANCGMVPSGLEEDCVWDPQRITVIKEINPKIPQSSTHLCGPIPHQCFNPGPIPHQCFNPGPIPYQCLNPGPIPYQCLNPGPIPYQCLNPGPIPHQCFNPGPIPHQCFNPGPFYYS